MASIKIGVVMLTHSWQLEIPLDAILFDCDGTLSTIEGIDELAVYNHVGEKVQQLTQQAMGKTGMSTELYAERLQLVHPTQQQVEALGQLYFDRQAPDVERVIQLCQHLKKSIYIISAGLYPAVAHFASLLKISTQHVYAVNIDFNSKSEYQDFDRFSPLTIKNGKRIIVEQIKMKHSRIAYIGDGLSDYEVYDLVTRFIGYGGIFYRQNIKDLCEYYIETPSMCALLPLILTPDEIKMLSLKEKELYDLGLSYIVKDF